MTKKTDILSDKKHNSVELEFVEKKINVCMAVDDNYIPYLYACLKSLLAHITDGCMYNIYVLHTDISESNKKNILDLKQKNLKIKFVNLNYLVDNDMKQNFAVNSHFTPETYYRFFLPQIFKNDDRILYLDADTFINHDISPLFDIDIKDYYLAATHDYEIIRLFNVQKNDDRDYFENVLKIDPEKYFQAGVMLFNLKKMREDKITDKLIECLKQIKTPKYVDQDILNVVCQNNIKFIPAEWDYIWHLPVVDIEYDKHLPNPYRNEYLNAQHNPNIVHFTSGKPFDYQNVDWAKRFFEYLMNSPYESWMTNKKAEVHKEYIKQEKLLKTKLLKYKILKIFTFGLCNKKYNIKIQKRKYDLYKIYIFHMNVQSKI